jgi:hypothetical protein
MADVSQRCFDVVRIAVAAAQPHAAPGVGHNVKHDHLETPDNLLFAPQASYVTMDD